jgi:hypothetical protein
MKCDKVINFNCIDSILYLNYFDCLFLIVVRLVLSIDLAIDFGLGRFINSGDFKIIKMAI